MHIYTYISLSMRTMFGSIDNCFIIIINSCEKRGKAFNRKMKRKKNKKKKRRLWKNRRIPRGETTTFLLKKFSKVKPTL